MSEFFTIGWQPPANIGLLPQHPEGGDDPHFTVGWVPKRSATWYPYDPAELDVPGRPPAGSPPPVVRPHTVRILTARRKDPGQFRRRGLRFVLGLEAPGTVTAACVSVPGGRKLTFRTTATLGAGLHVLTLRPTELGRLASLLNRRLDARIEVTVVYTDGARGSARRAVVIKGAG